MPSTSTCDNDNNFPDDDLTEADMLKYLEQCKNEGQANADQVEKLALSENNPNKLTNPSGNNDNKLTDPPQLNTKHDINMTKDMKPENTNVPKKTATKAKHEEKSNEEKCTVIASNTLKQNIQKFADAEKNMKNMSGSIKRADVSESIGNNITNVGSGSNIVTATNVKLEGKALVDGKVRCKIFPEKK